MRFIAQTPGLNRKWCFAIDLPKGVVRLSSFLECVLMYMCIVFQSNVLNVDECVCKRVNMFVTFIIKASDGIRLR